MNKKILKKQGKWYNTIMLIHVNMTSNIGININIYDEQR